MRRTSRAALMPLVALLIAGGAPHAADARPWTATYDWQADGTTGYENWTHEEAVPESGQPGPFYRWYFGNAPGDIGRGLAIQPIGGRVYSNGPGDGNPGKQEGGPGLIMRWNAPGASRITRAVYGDTKYRNEGDGQYMRSRVTGPDGHTIDYGPTYDEDEPDRTYINPAPQFNRTFTAGATAEFWLYTICGPNPDPTAPGPYLCPTVPANTGTFARVGSVNLTLDDPDQPALTVESSPKIDDGWVNKRRTQRLTVTAADPSSGIRRIRVQVRTGAAASGGRTLSDTNVSCDEDHRTSGRGGLVCPATATATATDPGSSQTAGDRTYVVTAWDYAGNQAVTTQTVRRDTEVPSRGDASGAALRELTNGWTNRVGVIPVRLTGEDSRAGVERLELLARRVASGRATELADVAPACSGDCRRAAETASATLDRTTLPYDGRYRLEVRVTDRAGNAKTFRTGEMLKVDRTAPKRSGPPPSFRVRRDGALALSFSPGFDPSDGAGIGDVFVRYYVGKPAAKDIDLFVPPPGLDLLPVPTVPGDPADARVVHASVAGLSTAPGERRTQRAQRSLVIRDREGIDPTRNVEVFVADRATGNAPIDELPNQTGNVRRDGRATPRGVGPEQRVPPVAAGRPPSGSRMPERALATDLTHGRPRSNPSKDSMTILKGYANNDRRAYIGDRRPKDPGDWPVQDSRPVDSQGRGTGTALVGQTRHELELFSSKTTDPVAQKLKIITAPVQGAGQWVDGAGKALERAHMLAKRYGVFSDDPRGFTLMSARDNKIFANKYERVIANRILRGPYDCLYNLWAFAAYPAGSKVPFASSITLGMEPTRGKGCGEGALFRMPLDTRGFRKVG